MIKSIALQNRAGAKTHPCLTPEVVENGEEQRSANRTLAIVAVCKSIIRPRMTFGTPMPFLVVLARNDDDDDIYSAKCMLIRLLFVNYKQLLVCY